MRNGIKVVLVLNIPPCSYNFGQHVPVSLLYLGAQLTREGHTVKVLDRRTFHTEQDFLKAIKETEADLIGICLFADGYTRTYKLVNQIMRFSRPPKTVLGGPEVSAYRDGVPKIFSNVDYFLTGEAEYSLSQLANCLAEGDKAGLESIGGLSYRSEDGIHHNFEQAPIKDVDSLPFPQRDLISSEMWKKWYYRPGLGRPTDLLLTSRGCPFSCKFCYRLASGYRARSPENVLEEIAEIHARDTKGLNIIDDNFTVNRNRCIKILEGILRKGWKFAIKCRGRVKNIDIELLKLMKRAGVQSVTFGIESGSQLVLDAMRKKTTVEQNYEAIRMVREAGLQCYADMFLGYPGETPETIEETSNFIMKAKPTGINMACLYPLHGTEVYEEAKNNGTLVGDWGILEEYPWVKLPWFDDNSELWKHWRTVSKRFWLNPGVIARGIRANISHFSVRDYWDVFKGVWYRNLRHKS
jgi:anaerobic magnesium-protoporphyrin IX monomethyl ester cyclase